MVVGLHQGGQPQGVANFNIAAQGVRVQQGTDQQHRPGAQHFGLVDLVIIKGKVLTQHGNGHCRCNLLQVAVVSQKVVRLRQATDGSSSGGCVVSGNVQVGEVRADETLGGAGLFHFTDQADPRCPQRPLKGKVPFGQRQGTAFYNV